MNSIKIKVMFVSIQGEGCNVGTPALFIRVSGCNLRCKFCDTKHSWVGGKDIEIDDLREKILNCVEENKVRHIVITGGEPSIYIDGWKKLFNKKFCSKLGIRIKSIDIETNGEINANWGFLAKAGFDTIVTISPKKFYADKCRKLNGGVKYKYKLIVDSIENVPALLAKLCLNFPVLEERDVYLQPLNNDLDLAKKLVEKNVYGCNLSLQWHKILGVK